MNKKFKKILLIIAGLIIILCAAFLIYASDYYHSDESAVETAEKYSTEMDNGDLYFTADDVDNYTEDNLIIFYPGGKVEYSAYAPLAHKLQQQGQNVVIIKMPLNLAVFGINKADNYIDSQNGINDYYLAGHSLGGIMASSYAAKHADQIEGLFLMGAYIYGDYSPQKQVTIYGTNDKGLDLSKITYTDNVYEIKGGNHAAFGNYGAQDGDGKCEIGREKQQNLAVSYILDYIN